MLFTIFFSAFFTGLCESNMAISQSIIADLSESLSDKTKLIGYAYSACSLGYCAGPLLGGFIGSIGDYSAPFWFTALGVLLLTAWIFYQLKESYTKNKEVSIHWIQSITAIKSIFNQPKFYKFYLINFSIFFEKDICSNCWMLSSVIIRICTLIHCNS